MGKRDEDECTGRVPGYLMPAMVFTGTATGVLLDDGSRSFLACLAGAVSIQVLVATLLLSLPTLLRRRDPFARQ